MRCLRCPHPIRRHSPLGCLIAGCRCASQEDGSGVISLRVLAAALAVLALAALGSCARGPAARPAPPAARPPRHLTDADRAALLRLVRDGATVLIPPSTFACKFVVLSGTDGDACVDYNGGVRKLMSDELAELTLR